MSGWHQVLMTDYDNDLIMKKYFPEFYQQYIDLPYPIQRADVARVANVIRWGGVYADLDYECLHNFEHLFKSSSETYLLRSGNIAATLTNSFFAGQPGSKMLLEYLNDMFTDLPWWRRFGKHIKVMNKTGPVRLSECSKKTHETYVALPSKRLLDCNICEINSVNGGPVKPEMWLRPLKGGSWNGYDTKFFNWWLCNWWSVLFFIVLIVVIILLIITMKCACWCLSDYSGTQRFRNFMYI